MQQFNAQMDRALLEFANRLDQLLLNGDPVLSEQTLALIEQYFGFSYCGFTLYSNNKHYRSIGHNFADLMLDAYAEDMHGSDPVKNYVSNDPALINTSNIKTIRASDIYARPDTDKEAVEKYLEFLGRSNLRHQVIAPVRSYRLSVYKSQSEEDFSDEECAVISMISNIIFTKFKIGEYHKSQRILNALKNRILANASIGAIIFNFKLDVIDCSETFMTFLRPQANQILTTSHFKNLILKKLPELSCYDPVPIEDESIFVNGAKVTLMQRMITPEGSFAGSTETYYIITAERPAPAARPAVIRANEHHTDFAKRYNLSTREKEIVDCIAQGHKSSDIADMLFISTSTVRTHIKNVYAKMGINNQRSLLALYNQPPAHLDQSATF